MVLVRAFLVRLFSSRTLAVSLFLSLAFPAGGQNLPDPVSTAYYLPRGCDGEILVARRLTATEIVVGGRFRSCGMALSPAIAIYDEATSNWRAFSEEQIVGLGGAIGPEVYAIFVEAERVYVAGRFSGAGSVTSRNITYFEAGQWVSMGQGLSAADPTFSWVNDLQMFEGDLFAGGRFDRSNGLALNNLARWDGVDWNPVGVGVNDDVRVLAIYDNELIVGGDFDLSGTLPLENIARWNGSSLSAVGDGLSGSVNALESHDGMLLAAADTSFRVHRWDGLTWNRLGSGLNATPEALAVVGPEVYAAGDFENLSTTLVRLDGLSWEAVAGAPESTILDAYADQSDLILSGRFETVNGVVANGIAVLAETGWLPVISGQGLGLNSPARALSAYGESVYAVGFLRSAGQAVVQNVAKLDGSGWMPLGNSELQDGEFLSAIAVNEDRVFVGGSLNQIGGVVASNIAQFDGSDWSALQGAGLPGVNGRVYAMEVGPAGLVVGGVFTQAGAFIANNIAIWDGADWEALGAGVSGRVNALAHGGGAIYVGGVFQQAGGFAAPYIGRYQSGQWSPLIEPGGSGLDGPVNAIEYRDGCVYAGGDFGQAGDQTVPGIAKWCGSSWESVGNLASALDQGTVDAIALVGEVLFLGGNFRVAGETDSRPILRLNENEILDFPYVSTFQVGSVVAIDERVFFADNFGSVGVVPSVGIAEYHEQSDFVFVSGFETSAR